MKKPWLYLFCLLLFCCKNKEKNQAEPAGEAPGKTIAVSYVKDDLKKVKWIEGKWKGMAGDDAFYEIYRFADDSTIEITTYEWDGEDSSNSSKSHVYLENGIYYFGDNQNWKTVSITDKEIRMAPNRNAFNEIVWKYRDSTGWDALLTGKKTVEYHMTAFDPFKK